MNEYHEHVTQIVVTPERGNILHELATHIGFADEGGGPFVVVTQPYQTREGITIEGKEWPAIRAAIDKMVTAAQGMMAEAFPSHPVFCKVCGDPTMSNATICYPCAQEETSDD